MPRTISCEVQNLFFRPKFTLPNWTIFDPKIIPTYGSDTLITLPEEADDVAAVKSLQRQVGDVYINADQYSGQARFDYLARELGALNR